MNDVKSLQDLYSIITDPDVVLIQDALGIDEEGIINIYTRNKENFLLFLQQYKKHEFSQGIPEKASFDENGRIDLNSTLHLSYKRDDDADGFYCTNNILFPNNTVCIMKEIPSYDEDSIIASSNKSIQNDELNCLIVQSLGKQMGIQTARYYLAKDKTNCIITLNFLQGRELISGEDVLKDPNIVEVEMVLKGIEGYLTERRRPLEEIEDVKLNFLKNTFFEKFIHSDDDNNKNWGLIIHDDKHFETAPCFDFEYTFSTTGGKNQKRINGKKDLEGFLKEFIHYPGLAKEIESAIEEVNTKDLFSSVKKESHVAIDEQRQEMYTEYIQQSLKITKEILSLYRQEEIPGEGRE